MILNTILFYLPYIVVCVATGFAYWFVWSRGVREGFRYGSQQREAKIIDLEFHLNAVRSNSAEMYNEILRRQVERDKAQAQLTEYTNKSATVILRVDSGYIVGQMMMRRGESLTMQLPKNMQLLVDRGELGETRLQNLQVEIHG